MHRSGTSLVTRLLQELGLHIGDEVQGDYEAIFYLNINDWILKKRGGSWDHPERLKPLTGKLLEECVAFAKKQIASQVFYHYFDPNKTLPNKWGWKDPRNSLNFPVWNEVYPEARYIHVYRNPVDVAESLRQRVGRSKDMRSNWKRRWKKLLNWQELIKREPRRKHEGDAQRLRDLNTGYSLWKSYIGSVDEWSETLGPDRIMNVCYEEFLETPSEILSECMDFIGLESKVEDQMISSINASRRYAFQKKEELNQFYQEIKEDEEISRWGYHTLQ